MKLGLLCASAGIQCPTSAAEVEIEGIAIDSRDAVAGGMFVCIRGFHTDGHAFVSRAVKKGVSCVLTEKHADAVVPHGVIRLETKNTRRAAAYLFDAWYGFPTRHMKLIGVTGTNGKTSVTHMIRAVLEASFVRCGMIGTLGCESSVRTYDTSPKNKLANLTTPDPPQLYKAFAEMAKDGVEYVVMEVSSHALALDKVAPLTFEVGIFTNLTPEHLDLHESMEAYADAKAKLFEKSRLSIIHSDSAFSHRMIEHAANRILTCSAACVADYTAERCVSNTEGVAFDLCSHSSRIHLACPIAGRFTVLNCMQAAICCIELGVPIKTVKAALASIAGIKGRMERVRLGLGADFSVLIDYAHTPDALEKLLCTAKELRAERGRIVLVFGCGGDRDKSKRAVMGRIASHYADYVIVTSDNARSEEPEAIIRDILKGIEKDRPYRVIADRREAIRYAVGNAQSKDLILLAGKGHEEYELIHNERLPFCEREIVWQAFEARQPKNQDTDCTESDA